MFNTWQSKINKAWIEWNRPLLVTAILHSLLAVIFLILSFFDDRLVLGLVVWVKPMKFAISIAIYTVTLSWLVQFVQSQKALRQIARWTIVGLWVETILISLQAARGTKSHFNIEDAFGIAVYALMGVFIAIVTLMLVWLAVEFAMRRPKAWSKLQFTSAQMALWLTVIGTLIGGWMSSGTGHTVGGEDGFAGLPILSWSTKLGDYRVSHFMGLHALQVFLLLGLWFDRLRNGRVFLWISFIIYTILLGLIFYITIQAKSIFSW